MGSQRYSIIVDTNILGYYKNNKLVCPNFKYLAISKEMFLGLVKFLSDNGLTENISVVVPKVVVEELKRQQEREYVAQLDKLKETFSRFAELPGFKLETPELDYTGHLEQKGKGFISKYGIVELGYPENAVLPKLIGRVLNREKPFYKSERGKDSGFKDALIWESILDYAARHKEHKIIFLTKDPDFRDTKLLAEVKEKMGKELEVIGNLTDVKTFLDEAQKLNLDFAWVRSLFNNTFREVLYRVLLQNFDGIALYGGLFRIRDFGVGNALVDIDRMDKDNYDLRVMISVWHETPYTGYGVVDDMYKLYEENEHAGVAVLSVEKTRENKLLLLDIRFEGVKLIGNNKINKVSLT